MTRSLEAALFDSIRAVIELDISPDAKLASIEAVLCLFDEAAKVVSGG